MAQLEDLTRGASLKGILPECLVTVVDVKWHGSAVVELTYKDPSGRLGSELLYRDREATIEVVSAGSPWSFDADGAMLRLVSEAYRIRLAYLFDPYLALHTSQVEPLPHQITAVYGEMLARQPLRFLLADDPGAGKTIMAGLLIKELLVRGDLHRCMVVTPGNLVEQWQDELYRKFQLPFEILTNDKLESARTGNWFQENPHERAVGAGGDNGSVASTEPTFNLSGALRVCREIHAHHTVPFGRCVRSSHAHRC